VVEKTLERPLVYTEITSVKPKGKQPEYALEGLMLKMKVQYFGYLWQERLKAGGEGINKG